MAWYFNKKQNSNYAIISADYDDLNSKIIVSQGIVKETDTEWLVNCIADSITSIRSKDSSFEFTKQPVQFIIHKSDWEKPTNWNSEQRKFLDKKLVKQSAIEKIYCYLFSSNKAFTTGFSGVLQFNSNWQESIIETLQSGTKDGKKLSQDTIEFLTETIYTVSLLENVAELPVDNSKSGSSGYAPRQTEKDRLIQRLEFLSMMLYGDNTSGASSLLCASKYCDLFDIDQNDTSKLHMIHQMILKLLFS